MWKTVSGAMHAYNAIWTVVSNFATKEDAVGFIMECQPFSFAPVQQADNPNIFPKFDTSHEALAYTLKMKPVPMVYESTVADFKRRLRIVFLESDGPEEKKKMVSLRRKGHSEVVAPVRSAAPLKPWVVEASGTFFESPISLRTSVE